MMMGVTGTWFRNGMNLERDTVADLERRRVSGTRFHKTPRTATWLFDDGGHYSHSVPTGRSLAAKFTNTTLTHCHKREC